MPANDPRTRDAEISDRRLLRGARSRHAVTRRAADIASLDGLDGLSFGRLADELDLSKAGIQTLFRTKEKLQLATVAAAETVFAERVVRPAADAAPGVARLRALVENWLAYAAEPVFPGGCFWSANLPEFDSRPGPVRDALVRQHHEWLALLARAAEAAVAAGELREADPELVAFELAAVLHAANTALRLGDTRGVDAARRIVDGLLGTG
ncbi:TetR/AcrR family transcriptional regulator [Nocardia blacklockiae]|uniref:TetR/AcrR family transcriptional regulator n=1 Tax=Nocardia blacklockiae TaxID=480036 RepID=UPI00189500DF|nr:TetR/AcrR family transcriptional regulator [Nocardia blacklockiae]MBF6171214.1 TetR/AcrR family transcriptional regulator [Nocardia blacklockiae]